MRERQAMIDQQVEDADKAREKLAEAEAAYKNALTEARVEAAQIRENARAEAQRTVEELRAQAQEESARIIARGEEQLARQRTAIVRELRARDRHAGRRAVGEDRRPAPGRRRRGRATVDSFIAGLEAQDTPPTASATAVRRYAS